MIKDPITKDVTFDMRTPEVKQHFMDATRDFVPWFEKEFGTPMFLIYGTSVGACRDHKLIGHDYDIDLAYLIDETDTEKLWQKVDHVFNTLKAQGRVKSRFDDGHGHVLSLDKEIVLDIWPAWFDVNGKFNAVGAYRERLTREDILPLRPWILEGYEFKVPNDYDKYLTDYYGKWQIPNTKYVYSSPRGGRVALPKRIK